MQRVVRSIFAGILTVAAVTACGDKVTVPGGGTTTPTGNVVHGVTVTPTSANMNIGDKLTFAASVNADAGVTDRTVTWRSTNTTVADVSATGEVTAKAAGTTSIIATSKADATQAASATVTVGALAATTVTIATINQTACGAFGGCNSVPANLANVAGQLDVTLNVDAGSNKLSRVELVMNCTGPGNSGTDTVVATQSVTGDLAPLTAEEAAAPVTLSYNTATFNPTTGAVAFKNGACTIKARAVTAAGTTVASSATALTLANPDVVIGTMTAGRTAVNPVTGLSWNGVSVKVDVLPVFFTPNRTAVSSTIVYEGKTATVGAGAQSITFVDRNDPAVTTDPVNIDNITDPNSQSTLTVNVVDNSGQNFTNVNGSIVTAASYFANPFAPVAPFNTTTPFRLDTKKPVSGSLNLSGNSTQNTGTFAINDAAYLNGSFIFAANAASGYRGADFLMTPAQLAANCGAAYVATNLSNCDFGGVDSVTVVFQTATSATGTYTTVTSASTLPETNVNTSNFLRQITTDRLLNADTTFVCGLRAGLLQGVVYTAGVGCVQYSAVVAGASVPQSARFGVDKTAPTLVYSGGEQNGNSYQNPALPGFYFLQALDVGTIGGAGVGTYGGPGSVLVAQTRLWNNLTSANIDPASLEGRVFSTNSNAALTGGTYSGGTAGASDACVIGRFNALLSNAGTGALTVFDRGGAVFGYCTPVAYTPTAGPSNSIGVPASANGLNGYYTTVVTVTDMANNVSTSKYTAVVLADNGVPTVGAPNSSGIDLPGSISGGTTVSFPTGAQDATSSATVGDIVGSWASLTYAATTFTLQYPVTTAGAGLPNFIPNFQNYQRAEFDNVLTRSATVAPSVTNFIKSLQVSNGTTAPANALVTTNTATSIAISAIDAANNVGSATFNFAALPVQITGTSTNFTAAGNGATFFTGGFDLAAPASFVSNCPATPGCGNPLAPVSPVNPVTTLLTATASGTSGAFNNPFTVAQLWYRPATTAPAGPWFLATSDVTVGTQQFADNGTTRQWIYNLTWNPPAQTPVSSAGAPINLTPAVGGSLNIEVMIIGVNANGDAVATPIRTVTVTNP